MNRKSTGTRNEKNTGNMKKRKLPWDVYKRKIGIVGLGNSGKTVLLTSLIDQIKNDRLSGITINDFKKETVQKKIGKEFPHEHYRRRLSYREWPEKTGKPLHYRCSFYREDFADGKMPLDLEFFDVPGERVADVAIVGNSFGKWSHIILDQLENVAGMKDEIQN